MIEDHRCCKLFQTTNHKHVIKNNYGMMAIKIHKWNLWKLEPNPRHRNYINGFKMTCTGFSIINNLRIYMHRYFTQLYKLICSLSCTYSVKNHNNNNKIQLTSVFLWEAQICLAGFADYVAMILAGRISTSYTRWILGRFCTASFWGN